MCFLNHSPDFHTSLCTQIYPLFLSLCRKLREVLWLLIIILIQMSYISESNDSYRYLLQSTRKIDIIVSPLKVDRISFLLQFSVPSPKSFRNTDSLIIA